MTLRCGHDAPAHPTSVCLHLERETNPCDVWRWYTGVGLSFELLCQACHEARASGAAVPVAPFCVDCFRFISEDIAGVVGVGGQPEIRVRESAPPGPVRTTAWPTELVDPLDVAPVGGSRASLWLVLGRTGKLALFDADVGVVSEKITIALPERPPEQPRRMCPPVTRLHASSDARFAAVAIDYGRYGVVVDLARRQITMQLDGGVYHDDTVPFSLAFFETEGRCRLIHRTAWNRLDVSDPQTGALLTARAPTSYRQGEKRPARYLDYFHGRLHVSPDGAHVLDDGWIWHPVGVPCVWNLHRWSSESPWEAEDGPSRTQLAVRNYYWDHGMCWGSERWLALAGLGDDDNAMVDGAMIFEFESGAVAMADGRPRSREFAGPGGEFFGDGNRLFSSDAAGLSVWDIADGARVQHVPDFRPTRQHRGARELAQVTAEALRRYRYA